MIETYENNCEVQKRFEVFPEEISREDIEYKQNIIAHQLTSDLLYGYLCHTSNLYHEDVEIKINSDGFFVATKKLQSPNEQIRTLVYTDALSDIESYEGEISEVMLPHSVKQQLN